MLLSNELGSITLPNRLTQALGPATRDAFAIFEDLCLLGNVRNSYNSNTSTRLLLSTVLTNYHDLFRKVCLSSPLPIRAVCQQLSSNHCRVHSIPNSYSYYNTSSSPCSSKPSPSTPLSRLPSAAHVLSSSYSSNSPSSKQRPKSSLHYSSNSLLARLTRGEPRPGWMTVLTMEIMCG
jgi:hypothetical protein